MARADEYTLLSALLCRAPSADLLKRLSRLQVSASPIGVAHAALAAAASDTTVAKAGQEFFDLFIGLGRGELVPYASFYLTGFLHERPLARLRGDLQELGIERAPENHEPEDHAALLCEIMASIANGTIPVDAEVEQQIFEKHLKPWIGRFFGDLEQAEHASFYRAVGHVGRIFIDIECEAFALPV
ncbi:TorD/DmsD family molecular chaperone [Variibacter gotjawalensis]|nr:TorA maturation chaperone TorD [Variibacter gotjawalensis]